MSLVAYDDSGSSEYEDDDQVTSTVTLNKPVEAHVKPGPSTSKVTEHENHDDDTNADTSLFNALPKPTYKVSEVIEEEDEFLHKKEHVTNIIKPKSKITVPSLSDFKDVADTVPTTKPRAVNGKKSGLLSILPQPKNGNISITTKSLIPHVLTKTLGNSNKQKNSASPAKKAKIETNTIIKDYSDDSDVEDDLQNDFFSINKHTDISDQLSLDIEQNMEEEKKPASNKKEVRSIESYFKKDIENNDQPEQANSEQNEIEMAYGAANSTHAYEVAPENDVILDDEAILKLVGACGKRKMEEIQIVDFNQQEVLAEARELLLKGLMEDTSKRVSASKKRGNEPTHMQKRKHQITYLAHQAKANEAELQNKWANNRMSKRQTQSKYGF